MLVPSRKVSFLILKHILFCIQGIFTKWLPLFEYILFAKYPENYILKPFQAPLNRDFSDFTKYRRGPPVDNVDRKCQNWFRCSKCVIMDSAAQCDPSKPPIPFTTTNHQEHLPVRQISHRVKRTPVHAMSNLSTLLLVRYLNTIHTTQIHMAGILIHLANRI